MRKTALLCRASLIASAFVGFTATPVHAQDAEASAEGDSGEIIVTARRREETLVDVPIAITALSGDQLANTGAMDITALAEQVPNVTLEASRGTNSTLSAFIRGIGQQDPVSGFEQGVGIYLDDVYLNRPQGAVLDIYDVERIEVLRGPQGTLYGRNTVGGAVKYVTKRLPNDFRLQVRGTYGSYNQADGVITASTPVDSAGIVRVGGSFARLTRDGFGTNLTTGAENYDKNVYAARGTLEVHGTDFFARVSGDWIHDKSSARGGHRLITSLLSNTPVLDNVFDTRGGLVNPRQDVEGWGVSLFMEAQPTESLTFRSITAYRADESFSPIDFDALPAVDLDVPAFYKNNQFSQELQMLVDAGPVQGLVGFYYLNANALTQFDVRLWNNALFPGLTAFTEADIGTDTMAGFADVTINLTDALSLSLGGRYTWDERSGRILRQNYLGGSPAFGGTAILFGAPSTNFRGKADFNKFTPKATISFKPNDDTTLYASYSQGFKGGGFDPRGVGTSAPTTNANGIPSDAEAAAFLTFLPEKVDSYEVGYKANLLDRRLYVAAAGFYMDYTDVQIPGSVACTSKVLVDGVVTQVPTFCGVVSNAGKARMKGFEFETRAKIIDNDTGTLTLSGSVGYIDAKFTKYITNIGGTPTDVAANRRIQNTPAWSGNAALDYSMALGEGKLTIGGGMSFKSKTYQFEVPNAYLDQPAYQLFDAQIVYQAPNKAWTLGVYGKNLTDERYKTSGYTFMAANATTGAVTQPFASALGREGTLTAFYGSPRQVFVTGTINF
ncbi:MAG: TonB-dependent receptor [Gammaproteobacteria bacterium]|nr:MAG: TonB-dependent receptor [Gammaproteobacteria bacterium]